MPKIPMQASRRMLPSAAAGGGNARNIASKAGAGLAAAGGAIVAGASNLQHAFAQAQRERDRVNAHLDSLNQHVGASRISLETEQGMQEDVANLQEQLQKQQDQDPRFWKVKIKNQDGEDIEVSPDDGMKILLQNRYDKAMLDADQYYGPEARARVAASLEQQAFNNISKFRSDHLKLRHDKQLADWQTITGRLEAQAADPTNRFRETAKQDLDDHVNAGIQAGIFSPTDGVKLKETLKDSIADKWATQYALRNPSNFLKMVEETQPLGEVGDGGAVPAGTLKKLPEDIRGEKLPHYTKIALDALAHQQSEVDRRDKQMEKERMQIHEQNYRGLMSEVLAGKSVKDRLSLMTDRNELSAPQAENLAKFEHALMTQKENDPEVKRASTLALAGFTQELTKAKYGMASLTDIQTRAEDAIAAGHLLPTDAQTLFKEFDAAQGYQVGERKEQRNKDIQHAYQVVQDILTTTGPMDKYDMVSENAKVAAKEDFWDTLARTPDISAHELRDKMLTRYQPIVAERRKIGDEDTQLKFDDAKMQRLVEQGAMSKAAYSEWKKRSETWRNIYKQALEQQQHPLPEPSMLDKLKNFGSSFFEESDAGAAQ